MIKLDPAKLIGPFSYIGGAIAELKLLNQIDERLSSANMPLSMRAHFLFHVNSLEGLAQELNLKTFIGVLKRERQAVEDLLAVGPRTRSERAKLATFGDKILSVFLSELESGVLVSLPGSHRQYFESAGSSFGKDVERAFHNSIVEIDEAGKCRSLGLWNAMVMHLMRAVEEPLSSLAEMLNVEPQQNWNSTLNQIEKALRERNRSNFSLEEEQWASAASAHIRAIKNAWRNDSQHGSAWYAEAEGISIWYNVQSLLQTLAKKL